MLFNSINFLIFFPIVTFLYFAIPHKYRWSLLLTASCIFYMWFIPIYIVVLALTIVIDYWAAILIEEAESSKKKSYLYISIISTCLVLFVFKYFNFFNINFSLIAKFFDLRYPIGMLDIILPVGLSFHTFQSLSYVIEVYRGHQKAERHFGIYSLYVMFYPQLVAGPIERPQNLIHQFHEKHEFNYERVIDGLQTMVRGFFKKVVVADQLATYVNEVYGDPSKFDGPYLVLATIFFAFQIYCDFSGYSDIAIGASRVMGFELMKNFDKPYFSVSVSEFWKRWHISLSTWFKDYLYISLGGNQCSKPRWYFNLFVTFLISGLWHGASWTYIIWGALNGAYLVFGLWIKEFKDKFFNNKFKSGILSKSFLLLSTFSLICFSWIFFRADSVATAWYIICHLDTGWDVIDFDFNKNTLLILLLLSFILLEIFQVKKGSIRRIWRRQNTSIRWLGYNSVITIILLSWLSLKDKTGNFIYFQF